MNRQIFISGCVQAFLAVSIGAFGAHALKDVIASDLAGTYDTGTQYHMFHAIALFVTAHVWSRGGKEAPLKWAGLLFNIGILLFSGSLYVLAITGIRGLGAITPFGGVAFLAGWIMLAISQVKSDRK